ncbi:hypothetical protein niasHT_003004 [Heterodera trifolii]|uniref:Uncharacterized protein n=1 Tax=Heterodera trifolii TaxID=157864 RepID=A0ABD2MFS0_9BILA
MLSNCPHCPIVQLTDCPLSDCPLSDCPLSNCPVTVLTPAVLQYLGPISTKLIILGSFVSFGVVDGMDNGNRNGGNRSSSGGHGRYNYGQSSGQSYMAILFPNLLPGMTAIGHPVDMVGTIMANQVDSHVIGHMPIGTVTTDPTHSANAVDGQSDLTFEDLTFEDLTFEDPTFEDLTFEDPTFEDPTFEDLTFEDPTFEDPTFEDPTFEDLTFEDPTFADVPDF